MKKFGVLFFVLFLVGSVSAVDYYLDAVNGNDDTGTGTLESPWKSFRNLLTYYGICTKPVNWKLLNAGDNVYLREGIYDEAHAIGSSSGCTTNYKIAYFDHIAGTENAPIKLTAYPGEYPIIDGQGIYSYPINLAENSWWEVSNIEIRNTSGGGVMCSCTSDSNLLFENLKIHDCYGDSANNPSGIQILNSCLNVTIRNNTIYNVYDPENSAEQNNAGIMIFTGNNLFIHNNDISRCGSGIRYKHPGVSVFGEPVYSEIYRNYVHDTFNYGITVGTSNAKVYQNIVSNVSSGINDNSDSGPHLNNTIFSNSFYGIRGNVFNAVFTEVNWLNVTFKDNVLNGLVMMFFPDYNRIKYSNYNCFSNNAFNCGPGITIGSIDCMYANSFDLNSIITTNQYNNPPSDFKLSSTSPCRNAASDGSNIGAWISDNPDYEIGVTGGNFTGSIEEDCSLTYDISPCNCLTNTELGNGVNAWFRGELGIGDLMQHLNLWRTNSSC